MNRIPTRVDRTRSVTTATPFHVPPTRRPSETPRAQLAKPKRVFLAGPRHGAPAWIRRTRLLADAAGARLEWIHSSDTTADIERAIAASDAVVVADAPALLAERPSIARRFHSVAKAVSVFGSNLAPRSLRPLDLLLVGATGPSAGCWERSVRLACGLASEERRSRVHCAVRDPGWPILASDRAIRFRRISRDYRDVKAIQTSHQDARRRLLFEAAAYELLVADAGDVDALARAARASAGWCSAAPAFFFGDRCLLLDLDIAAPPRARSAEAGLAVSLAMVRLLRQLGEDPASRRIAAALHAEVAERRELAADLWLDLATDTPGRFLDAVTTRLVAIDPHAN